jgi:hypothetical protein
MFTGLVGVLALAVVATMVYQVVRKGSQGPGTISAIGGVTKDFYGTLMGG